MAGWAGSGRLWLAVSVVGALLAVGCSPPLDTTFGGGDGIVTIGGPSISADNPAAVAVQPDGKVLLVFTSFISGTSYTIARFLPNGNLDTSFGVDGRVDVHRFASYRCADI